MPHSLILGALDPWGIVMTILGLGALIFFHELGHFLACRLTKTRVEAFSIGFGPQLVGWRRGPTLYKICAIPLGGYVKMAAENPGEKGTGAPDEFPNKSFSQRLFIMSNGVIFNVLLALGLYIWAFGIGTPFPTTKLGFVVSGEAAWEAGLRAGDRVTHVNGESILSFADLKTEVAFSSADEVIELTVERDGETFTRRIRPRYSEAQGMPVIGVEPQFESTVREGSLVAKAGAKDGDTVIAANGIPLRTFPELQVVLPGIVARHEGQPESVPLTLTAVSADGEERELRLDLPTVAKPHLGIMPFRGNRITKLVRDAPAAELLRVGDRLVAVNGAPVVDLGVFRETAPKGEPVETITVERDGKRQELRPAAPLTVRAFAYDIDADLELATTRVAPHPGMPAARAGVQIGDRVRKIDDANVNSFEEIRDKIAAIGMRTLTLTIERGEQTIELPVTPARRPDLQALGYGMRGVFDVHREDTVAGSIAMGWRRTVLTTKSIVLTVRSLVTRRVSARHIGGPITLAQVTYSMFDLGWARYLYILAMISINLAILNLLPIPVLDGGQIVLLCAEKLRGEPLPDRVVGYLQFVGLILILSLMVLAFYNDIARLLT